jgi:hypothetical protein
MAAKSDLYHSALYLLCKFITECGEWMLVYAELEEEWGELMIIYSTELSSHSSSPRVEFLVLQV